MPRAGRRDGDRRRYAAARARRTPRLRRWSIAVRRGAAERGRSGAHASIRARSGGRLARGRRGVALALALVLAAPFVERAAQVAYIRLFPASVSVQVDPGDMRVPAGRPVTFAAAVAGRRGTLGRIAPAVTLETAPGADHDGADGPRRRWLRVAHRRARASFTYRVTAGPARVARLRGHGAACRRACSASSCTTTIRRSPASSRAAGARRRRRLRSRRHARPARRPCRQAGDAGTAGVLRRASPAWRWRAWTIARSSRRSPSRGRRRTASASSIPTASAPRASNTSSA